MKTLRTTDGPAITRITYRIESWLYHVFWLSQLCISSHVFIFLATVIDCIMGIPGIPGKLVDF